MMSFSGQRKPPGPIGGPLSLSGWGEVSMIGSSRAECDRGSLGGRSQPSSDAIYVSVLTGVSMTWGIQNSGSASITSSVCSTQKIPYGVSKTAGRGQASQASGVATTVVIPW